MSFMGLNVEIKDIILVNEESLLDEFDDCIYNIITNSYQFTNDDQLDTFFENQEQLNKIKRQVLLKLLTYYN